VSCCFNVYILGGKFKREQKMKNAPCFLVGTRWRLSFRRNECLVRKEAPNHQPRNEITPTGKDIVGILAGLASVTWRRMSSLHVLMKIPTPPGKKITVGCLSRVVVYNEVGDLMVLQQGRNFLLRKFVVPEMRSGEGGVMAGEQMFPLCSKLRPPTSCLLSKKHNEAQLDEGI
jgi:hypothetical protein